MMPIKGCVEGFHVLEGHGSWSRSEIYWGEIYLGIIWGIQYTLELIQDIFGGGLGAHSPSGNSSCTKVQDPCSPSLTCIYFNGACGEGKPRAEIFNRCDRHIGVLLKVHRCAEQLKMAEKSVFRASAVETETMNLEMMSGKETQTIKVNVPGEKKQKTH